HDRRGRQLSYQRLVDRRLPGPRDLHAGAGALAHRRRAGAPAQYGALSMEQLVSVENLAIEFATKFGPVPALKGVSFAMNRGEALGVVGESGSGKTVACRAILKLIAANAKLQSGRILVGGQDVLTMGDAELQKFRGEKSAMIFQNPSTHL